MNNKFKLPKIDILFQSITLLKAMVFPLLFIIINLVRKLPWWGTLSGIVALILIIIVIAFLSWRSFSYLFEKDRIVIFSGWIQKKEKTIYYSRIHSVNITQNIVHRLFKLANLTIETPGMAGASADGEVRCLSIHKAKYLQSLLQRMGEASRQEEEQKKEQLLKSIVLNMQNSTSSEILSSSVENNELEQISNQVDKHVQNDQINHLIGEAEKEPDLKLSLDIVLMLKSALTSLNINIVLIWFAGIFAFADDIYNTFFPNSTFFDDIFNKVEVSQSSIIILVAIILIGAIFMTWLLSIAFYVIKFFDYKLIRNGKQINVSYGLFVRQSIVFDETKVQSIVFDENPLRQMMGFGELKVNIVRSLKEGAQAETTDIVINPFIKKNQIRDYLQELMPKCVVGEHKQTEALPKKSLYTYLLVPTIITIIPAPATAYWFHWHSLWLLFLPMVVVIWRIIQFRSAAFSIEDKEIKLVKRAFSKYTVYVKRQKIISIAEKTSPYQRKHQLSGISIRTLGGLIAKNYTLNGLKAEHTIHARKWLQQYISK